MGPRFRIKIERASHVAVAVGFMDRRYMIFVLWPVSVRVGWW